MTQSSRFRIFNSQEKSMVDYVTDTLRKAIILRTLRLGERLVESKVAAELNVSITPLRQAFQKLASEGLIEVFPYRGSYVTTITPEFIEDVCFCRNLLEMTAVEYAYDNMVAENPRCLLEIVEQGVDTYRRTGELFDIISCDILLHQTIVAHCGRKTLLDFWRQLSPRIMLLLSYSKSESFDVSRFLRNHMPIAEAVANREGKETLIQLLQHNLDHAYSHESLSKILEEARQRTE